MSKGRGLALLKAIKERQLQEESQPTRSEIGENEKSRLIEALKERKKALEATEASQGNFSETSLHVFLFLSLFLSKCRGLDIQSGNMIKG